MNFLAHLFLSGESKEIRVGNFIADAVKGLQYKQYPADVQKGIKLHRAIDSFTDNHPAIHQSKERIRPFYGKYSGIVIDVLYDHFLSINWINYTSDDLNGFIKNNYLIMLQHFDILPSEVKRFLPFLVVNNWLGSYQRIDGVKSVLERMSKHTTLPDYTLQLVEIYHSNFENFQNEFNVFFPELIENAGQVLKTL